ncbi:efflux RND transporter periplasmic adaptor subunit [Xinfangfangia sp. CPCC 101601]|uniref:Efflux RND transporter periplasmic adaptor subunit n=1 Tax=Pseudogemmobacter lacusdianii TaxID=3069608 RepID=A0ABU0W2I7_9RHOB|nr:efflux RND transporter periplasmic adaptor subunit [Xinfangfangia sp. CPCC 101601]MDQ2067645.1 efflux RND transporter periplasmic adaptor subunit [Xinfangfangia sp. CPCC 101601]
MRHMCPVALLTALLVMPALAPTPLRAEAATDKVAEVLPAITVAPALKHPLVDRIIASGLIEPVEEVHVAPLIEGQPIEALLVDVGELVEEGQVLALLSKSSLELSLAQVKASEASAAATVAQADAQLIEAESSAAEAARVAERTAKLRDQGSASQAAADSANAGAVSATARVTVARQSRQAALAQQALQEAQLANIELQLSRTEVKAPVAGVITARNATLGAIASAAGLPMFVMERDGALEFRADLAEADLPRVTAGAPAKLTAAGLAEPLQGEVRLVEPAIDATTRLGRARISVTEPGALRSGMFVEAEITLAAREGLAVPVTAVGSDKQGSTVMRVKDGVVERVTVTTGIRDGGLIEITQGLEDGDLVVVKAASFVRAGDRINPVPQASN